MMMMLMSGLRCQLELLIARCIICARFQCVVKCFKCDCMIIFENRSLFDEVLNFFSLLQSNWINNQSMSLFQTAVTKVHAKIEAIKTQAAMTKYILIIKDLRSFTFTRLRTLKAWKKHSYTRSGLQNGSEKNEVFSPNFRCFWFLKICFVIV